MTTTVVVLEQLTLTAPFGVRFWDVATSAPAEAGLNVIAWPDNFPERRTTATVGPSGVYSFSNLPGLRDFENGAGDDAFWAVNPPTTPYTVQVSDPALRYLAYEFSVTLPARGLYGLWDSPLSNTLTPGPDWLPVFSGPSRILPGPAGAIYATLWDDAADAPAAWALLSSQAAGLPSVTALADDRGVVALFQPYPEPSGSGINSPLSAPNLSNQSWPVEVSVHYSRIPAVNAVPDLNQILEQGPATVWRDSAHTAPANEFDLKFGTDLVLRSLDSASGRDMPVLLVTPATSPL
jgi:hypothetical protein